MTAHEPTRTFVLRCTALAILCAVALVWPFRCAAIHPDVVKIRVDEGHQTSCGSGTLIGKNDEGWGIIVTCCHLFERHDYPIHVEFASGERRGATLLHADRSDDIAVIAILDPPSDGTPLAEHDVQAGETVTIVGYGVGLANYLEQRGRVTTRVSFDAGQSWDGRSISVRARQGDSGGPIIDANGNVCGIIAAHGHGDTVGTCGAKLYQLAQDYCGPACQQQQQQSGRRMHVWQPSAPLMPINTKKKPAAPQQPATAAPRPDIDPTRPITPSGRSEDIQDIKKALDKLTAEVAAGRCRCDPPLKEITDLPPLKPVPQIVVKESIDYAKLAKQIAAQLPPTTVIFDDGHGGTFKKQIIPIGGTLRLPANHVRNFTMDSELIDEEKYPLGTPIKMRHGVPPKGAR